jgi:hypothetical protein
VALDKGSLYVNTSAKKRRNETSGHDVYLLASCVATLEDLALLGAAFNQDRVPQRANNKATALAKPTLLSHMPTLSAP